MSLDFGKKLAECRKAKGLSQKELARLLNTSHSVIGKYEREEMTPSIEVAVKLANLLDTTIAYLLGENKDSNLMKDPAMFRRIAEIEKLPERDRECLLLTVDNFIKATKLNLL
jgi:transcriptional regulator with XRE-family HTH domain